MDSLACLLKGSFDYAGLYPPAQLPMQNALAHFRELQSGPHQSWVGRFVCPADRLSELSDTQEPGSISVTGRASTDLDSWGTARELDARDMSAYLDRGLDLEIGAYEARAPGHDMAVKCAYDLRAFDAVDVFLELPWAPAMDDSLAMLAEMDWIMAKARTGGLTPDAFPTEEELAGFLVSCVNLDLSFKLTAGLHHPVPRWDEEIGARMHGFLNVLVGACLAYSADFTVGEVAEILRQDAIPPDTFAPDGIHWGDHVATLQEIEEFRQTFLAIGSCSIEEPVVELARIKLI